jgi:hypothetical protein
MEIIIARASQADMVLLTIFFTSNASSKWNGFRSPTVDAVACYAKFTLSNEQRNDSQIFI